MSEKSPVYLFKNDIKAYVESNFPYATIYSVDVLSDQASTQYRYGLMEIVIDNGYEVKVYCKFSIALSSDFVDVQFLRADALHMFNQLILQAEALKNGND